MYDKSLADSKDYENFHRSPQQQAEITDFLYEIPYETWAYEQHLFFIDFNRFHVAWEDQPNMINIMRQPIARRISDIYFKFTDQIKLDNSAKLNLEQCIQRRRGHCIVGNLQINILKHSR